MDQNNQSKIVGITWVSDDKVRDLIVLCLLIACPGLLLWVLILKLGAEERRKNSSK